MFLVYRSVINFLYWSYIQFSFLAQLPCNYGMFIWYWGISSKHSCYLKMTGDFLSYSYNFWFISLSIKLARHSFTILNGSTDVLLKLKVSNFKRKILMNIWLYGRKWFLKLSQKHLREEIKILKLFLITTSQQKIY